MKQRSGTISHSAPCRARETLTASYHAASASLPIAFTLKSARGP